jgi:hypothetical protein
MDAAERKSQYTSSRCRTVASLSLSGRVTMDVANAQGSNDGLYRFIVR